MPEMTYTRREVNLILRIAYATGVRDTVIQAGDGALLDEEQALKLARFVTDPRMLAETARTIYGAAALARLQGVKADDE